MSLKKKIIDKIIEKEGGYVNNPHDGGGETNYGITIAKAREYGYRGSMKDLPLSVAEGIYGIDFWDKLMLDEVENLSPSICYIIADTAVNMGQSRVITMLQGLLNALNVREKLYSDIPVDGNIGNQTLAALKNYLKARKNQNGEDDLCFALSGLRVEKYFEFASQEKNDKDETFIQGWIRRARENWENRNNL